MRGIYTPVTDIRRKVFTEVARMAYEVNELSDYEKLMRELPFKIIPGEEKSLRRRSARIPMCCSSPVSAVLIWAHALWSRPSRACTTMRLTTA